jgi:hypothetical protein
MYSLRREIIIPSKTIPKSTGPGRGRRIGRNRGRHRKEGKYGPAKERDGAPREPLAEGLR